MTPAPDFRALPRIDGLVAAAPELVARFGAGAATAALRDAVATARTAMAAGAEPPTMTDLILGAEQQLTSIHPAPPRRVLNATGVVVHTNLGRAPLSEAAADAVAEAVGYCDVEYDLADGSRGTRTARLQPLLTAVTGAQAGLAVNNAAAALVLSLAALAGGRDVLVSRGELVEIGGSFRLPEILTAAGVRLVEVGTTNRTRATDYEAGDDVGLLLKVHPSNYRIAGFSEAPTTAALAEVARRRGVPLLYDVGSGLLAPRREPWLATEPDVRTALADGADLVVCSGDKLLGGPQAGLLVGSADLVNRCARHPLARALRLDKLRLAALVATLQSHARGELDELPVWSALLASGDTLRERLQPLADGLAGAHVIDGAAVVGGGSAPGADIPTPILRIPTDDAQGVARRLRRADPPVIVRITDDHVLVDVRAIPEADDARLLASLQAAIGAEPTQ